MSEVESSDCVQEEEEELLRKTSERDWEWAWEDLKGYSRKTKYNQ